MTELRDCLIKETDKLIREFAEKTNSTVLKFGEYKGFVSWSLSCSGFKIEFVFTTKKKFFLPVHTLFVRLFLNQRFPDYFHPSEIMDYIEPDVYRGYYYPYIESIETMDKCFEDLSEFLFTHFERFEQLANNFGVIEKLVDRKREDIIRNLSLLESEKRIMEKRTGYTREDAEHILENYLFYERVELVDRFTGDDSAYSCFLRGKHEKAVKKLEKAKRKNKHYSFENRLLDYLNTKPSIDRKDIIPTEADTLARTDSYKKQESREGLISCVVQYIIYALVLLVINFGFSTYYESLGAILVIIPPLWTVFLFAVLPAMFGSYALKDWIVKLLRIRRVNAYDGFFEGEKAKAFVRIVFTIVGTLTLMLYIGLCLGATRFYEDKLVLPADLNDIVPISFEEKNYADIETLYFIEGRYNEYGDYIDRSSYVLKFLDGYIYDFDRDTNVAYTEDVILPLIKSYYDEVVRVKSDREI